MKKKVIFDLGAHKGEDSDFYLKKGFRVIAIDASEKLCEAISARFRDQINSGDFKLLNYAITEKDDDEIPFYINTSNSVWGTIFKNWDNRNSKVFGTDSIERTVKTKRLDSLIEQEIQDDEEIEYIKIDIEGADLIALRSLGGVKQKPAFISIESEKVSWKKLLEEFNAFKQLGYTKFKLVDQSKIQDQVCPSPSQEGDYVNHKFEEGCSGLFGKELPGKWLTAEEAIKCYKKIFRRYRYFGDFGIFNNKLVMHNSYLKRFMDRFRLKFPHVGWYDTHAAI